MKPFPLKLLQARHAILSGQPHSASLEILLAPFEWNGALADTSLRLDGIDLPSVHLADLATLADQTLAFALNPDEGAIDGSIYLGSAHHPIDVASLTFLRSRHDGLKVMVKGVYVFEHEGLDDIGNTPFTLTATLSACAI